MRRCACPSPSSSSMRRDVDANIERATRWQRGGVGGARLVVLPEYLQYRGPDDGFRASARPIPGPYTDAFAEVARRHDAWILAGVRPRRRQTRPRPHNTGDADRSEGRVAATYRKIHLFDVPVDDGPVDTESDRVSAGGHRWSRRSTGSRVGLRSATTSASPSCIDARPRRCGGADRTDQLHGANGPRPLGGPAPRQGHRERRVGPGPGRRRSAGFPAFGRSMVIDPWGTVVAQAPDGVGIVQAEVEPDRVAAVRRQIPSLAHRRPETYRLT